MSSTNVGTAAVMNVARHPIVAPRAPMATAEMALSGVASRWIWNARGCTAGA